ncbi:MAG: alpha/beta hydrolase [Chloroflexi bacterium]|nr:alpha/beta hydrolase [Chloroflexota bacterium]
MPSSYLYLNGIRVHYLQWETQGDGIPIVLLHGLASNARIWELVAPHLVAQGYSVFAPDARGHGLTDKPDGDYGFDTYTKDLAAFVEACHLDRPLLVGHSWGANRAIDFAARFSIGPFSPRGIVLVDGGFGQLDEPGATWEDIRRRLTPPRLAGMPLEMFLDMMNNHHPISANEEIRSIVLANFEIYEDDTTGVELITPRLTFEHHMQIVAAMWEFKTFEIAARLRCPVLAIPASPTSPGTEAERQFLSYKERGLSHMQEILPNLQVHWMIESIHDIPLQHPLELAELISDFARKVK